MKLLLLFLFPHFGNWDKIWTYLLDDIFSKKAVIKVLAIEGGLIDKKNSYIPAIFIRMEQNAESEKLLSNRVSLQDREYCIKEKKEIKDFFNSMITIVGKKLFLDKSYYGVLEVTNGIFSYTIVIDGENHTVLQFSFINDFLKMYNSHEFETDKIENFSFRAVIMDAEKDSGSMVKKIACLVQKEIPPSNNQLPKDFEKDFEKKLYIYNNNSQNDKDKVRIISKFQWNTKKYCQERIAGVKLNNIQELFVNCSSLSYEKEKDYKAHPDNKTTMISFLKDYRTTGDLFSTFKYEQNNYSELEDIPSSEMEKKPSHTNNPNEQEYINNPNGQENTLPKNDSVRNTNFYLHLSFIIIVVWVFIMIRLEKKRKDIYKKHPVA